MEQVKTRIVPLLLLMQLFYLFQPFSTAALATILPRIGLLARCLYCLARSTPKRVY